LSVLFNDPLHPLICLIADHTIEISIAAPGIVASSKLLGIVCR